MSKKSEIREDVVHTYRERALRYDFTVGLFNLFSLFGFSILAWRTEAIRALDLKPENTVVDIGCGTGLNFELIQAAIGPKGKIIGVDISEAMLDQARRRADEKGWKNIELVCTGAAEFEFPVNVDAVLSTLTLILVPECGRVVEKSCAALVPGKRLVVFDMAWPAGWPEWFRHVLFFLRSYGVTGEVLRRRSWETVWKTMKRHLVNIERKEFWMGFFYLAKGVRGSE